MKQMAGHTKVRNNVPALLERGLNTHQGLLTAIWSDPRISATCVHHDEYRPDQPEHRGRTPLRALKEADLHSHCTRPLWPPGP